MLIFLISFVKMLLTLVVCNAFSFSVFFPLSWTSRQISPGLSTCCVLA
jgi:hypothetical protein